MRHIYISGFIVLLVNGLSGQSALGKPAADPRPARGDQAAHMALFDVEVRGTHAWAGVDEIEADPNDVVGARLRRLSARDLDEVVWLARCIYSESDRANEQELVAWVVRNRVETHYRGTTYREVVLEARQFSAFNEPSKRRNHILNLDHETPLRPWRRALKIALDVYQAPASRRPFAKTVRHFYSPISMVGGRVPHWADRDKALSSVRLGVDRSRFIFFNDVDERLIAGGVGQTDVGNVVRNARHDDGGSGFKLKIRRPSGKVSRPRRPSVQTSRFSRGR